MWSNKIECSWETNHPPTTSRFAHGYADLEIYKMTFGTNVKAHAFVYRVKYIYLRVSLTKLWSRKKINLCILIFIDQYFGRGYDTPIAGLCFVLFSLLFLFFLYMKNSLQWPRLRPRYVKFYLNINNKNL